MFVLVAKRASPVNSPLSLVIIKLALISLKYIVIYRGKDISLLRKNINFMLSLRMIIPNLCGSFLFDTSQIFLLASSSFILMSSVTLMLKFISSKAMNLQAIPLQHISNNMVFSINLPALKP